MQEIVETTWHQQVFLHREGFSKISKVLISKFLVDEQLKKFKQPFIFKFSVTFQNKP
jgi:hypothetical protein